MIPVCGPGTIEMKQGWLVTRTDVRKGGQQMEPETEREKRINEVDAHLMLL